MEKTIDGLNGQEEMLAVRECKKQLDVRSETPEPTAFDIVGGQMQAIINNLN